MSQNRINLFYTLTVLTIPLPDDIVYPLFPIYSCICGTFISLNEAEKTISRIVRSPERNRVPDWQSILGFFIVEREYGVLYHEGILEYGEWPECNALHSYDNMGNHLSEMRPGDDKFVDRRFREGDYVNVLLGDRVELGRIRSVPSDISGLLERIPDLEGTPYCSHKELLNTYQVDMLEHYELGETGIKSPFLFPLKGDVPIEIKNRFDKTDWKAISCYAPD